MLEERSIFYKIVDLKKLYQADSSFTVVVWGTGEVALEVYETLSAFSIPVDFFGDNATEKYGKPFCGKTVLDAKEVSELPSPFVVIGSYVVRPVWEQLSKLGINNIYAVIDTLKYSYSGLLDDTVLIKESIPEEGRENDDILLEAYGNIGDVVLRGGIFRFFVERFGREHVHILVETESIAAFARLFSNNVFVGEKSIVKANRSYREKLLQELNRRHFKASYILSDIRLHFTRRFLNDANFNVKNVRYHSDLPDNQYLPEMDAQFVREEFKLPASYEMPAKGCIDYKLAMLPAVADLPEKYVVMHMGASKEIRHYASAKIAEVVDYLYGNGFKVVVIGNGNYDEIYYEEMRRHLRTAEETVAYISRLSLLQSFRVILDSEFFVGTDSGMWNISYILNKKSVVIYGGGEFGNFRHGDPGVHYAEVPRYECFGCKWFCRNRTLNGYAKCIDDITPQMIIKEIDKIIEVGTYEKNN